MLNFKDKNITIGGVVAELPKASIIFYHYGIDFCCGGHRKLSDVVNEQGLNQVEIMEKLQQAQEERVVGYKNQNFTEMSVEVLTDYIEDTHHAYLRSVLPDIAELLGTILRVHGKNHRELFEVYRLYGSLKSDLEQHLLKEETLLFPAMEQADSTASEILAYATDIIKEHEAAGKVLTDLRHVTGNYSLPQDVCNTFRRTYEMLMELEADLHQHIHLENNILLKEYDFRVREQ